jgi:nodulation protein E
MRDSGRRRVVVTGAGAVSAPGIGADALWHAARDGQSGVGPLVLTREVNNKVKIAAQVRDFSAERYLPKNVAIYCDIYSAFAIVAADEAIHQAGLASAGPLGSSAGVVLGVGAGGINTIETVHFTFLRDQGRIDPLAVPKVMPSSATSHLCIRYGCTGPSFAVASACASATQAIGIGANLIQQGMVDRVLVGGADSTIAPVSFRSWEALRVLTPDFCRPFSKGRNGMVLGEGAAIFVLEALDVARGRDAPLLAEVLGYGTSTDAVDMLRPDIRGALAAMKNALDDAGIAPDDVDYINAHGTGTILNDTVEAQAIRQLFGDRTDRLPVSSTKPIHGHALGAAGALEFLVTVRALMDDIVPPTINWIESDANCPVDPVANQARPLPLRTAMSNSFAFGGINAVVIVGKPDAH